MIYGGENVPISARPYWQTKLPSISFSEEEMTKNEIKQMDKMNDGYKE